MDTQFGKVELLIEQLRSFRGHRSKALLTLLRLPLGLEDADKFVGDISQALDRSRSAQQLTPTSEGPEMKAEFLYASINDTQSTIRSIDVRAGFVFVLLFLPLSVVDKLSVIFPLPAQLPWVVVAWIVIASIFWLLAIITIFRCIVAIDDPATHVRNSNANGSFYGGDLFPLDFIHAFANRPVLSARDVDGEIALLPSDETALERELVFEKIKLAYIRAAKIQRFAFATWLTLGWLTASGALALFLRVHSWG